MKLNALVTQNSDTHFALTKMSLLGYEKVTENKKYPNFSSTLR